MELENFDKFIAKCEKDMSKHIEKEANKIQKKAIRVLRKKSPVRTGRYRRSWKTGKLEGNTIRIYNNTDYAIYVEYPHRTRDGKRVIEGQFVLRDSLKVLEKDMPEHLKHIVNTYWNGEKL